MIKRIFTKKSVLILLVVLFVSACGSVMLTNRRQFLLYSDSEVNQMSSLSYNEFLSTNKLSKDYKGQQRIERIGARISKAVETYMISQGLEDEVKGFDWEFNLVESKELNAWCMPGGKVVFYEGIIPVCANDDGIAVVMGHEIAHAVAKHSNERMSQQALLSVGQQLAMIAVSDESQVTRTLTNVAVGLGSQYGIVLPFSRKHESEADYLGMIFMTMAGYNPAEAVDFWTRMSKSGGKSVPEFMSTHPSDETRVKALQSYLKEMDKYRP